MSNPCELPPCPPCPPKPPPPCPQVCPPPCPPSPCRGKPAMRGLHWAQTKRNLAMALTLSTLCGATMYFVNSVPRRAAYKDFYAKGEFDEWAEEMARKGLFQSVPADTLKDKTK